MADWLVAANIALLSINLSVWLPKMLAELRRIADALERGEE